MRSNAKVRMSVGGMCTMSAEDQACDGRGGRGAIVTQWLAGEEAGAEMWQVDGSSAVARRTRKVSSTLL